MSISMNDFVTFNPSSASLTPPLNYTPNLLVASGLYPAAGQVPRQIFGQQQQQLHPAMISQVNANPSGMMNGPQQLQQQLQDDVSMNASFQTELKQLLYTGQGHPNYQYLQQHLGIQQYIQQEDNGQDLQQMLHQHINQQKQMLNAFNEELSEQRQQLHQLQQSELTKHLHQVKQATRDHLLHNLQELKDQLLSEHDRLGVEEETYFQSQLNSIDKERLLRRYEQRLKEERDQYDMLQSVEVERRRVQYQSKLNIEKQKILAQSEDELASDHSYQTELSSLSDLRFTLEDQADTLRLQLQDQVALELNQLRRDQAGILDREKSKAGKAYGLKLTEEIIRLQQQAEEIREKKEIQRSDIQDKTKEKLRLEMEKMDLEYRDSLRSLKLSSDKEMEKKKHDIKKTLELRYVQLENQMVLEHHSVMRDITLEKQDKYKLHKEKEYRDQVEKLDKQFLNLQEERLREMNKEETLINSHEKLVKEIECLKWQLKDKRKQKKNKEVTLESDQLMNQKLTIKFEVLKTKIREDVVHKSGDRERVLEKELKTKEEELKSVNDDIIRVREYMQVMQKQQDALKSDPENNLIKDLENVRRFIQENTNGNGSKDQNPNDELNELRMIIPKEIERVQEQIFKLQSEKETLKTFQKTIGQDMMVGLTDGVQQDKKEMGPKVWNLVASMKIDFEQESSKLRRDLSQLTHQLGYLKDSLHLLQDLKLKVDSTLKLISLSSSNPSHNQNYSQIEAQEDLRRLKNEFKHYIRRAWCFKREAVDEEAEIRMLGRAVDQQYLGNFIRPLDEDIKIYNEYRQGSRNSQSWKGFRSTKFSNKHYNSSLLKGHNQMMFNSRPQQLISIS